MVDCHPGDYYRKEESQVEFPWEYQQVEHPYQKVECPSYSRYSIATSKAATCERDQRGNPHHICIDNHANKIKQPIETWVSVGDGFELESPGPAAKKGL